MKRVSREQLTRAAKDAGLTLKDCGAGHLQVIGGIAIVNFYNGNKGTKIYVQGNAQGRRVSSAEEVIRAATKFKRNGDTRARRNKSYKGAKSRKWESAVRRGEKPSCHWCGGEFESRSDATADHVIPLSKGGSNGDDNIVLACRSCNTKRGNKVTANEIESTRNKARK